MRTANAAVVTIRPAEDRSFRKTGGRLLRKSSVILAIVFLLASSSSYR